LSAVPIGELEGEVAGSRTSLERLVGRPVTAFAYPYGDTAPAAVTAVQDAGFTVAVCCEQRPLRPWDDRLCLPRLGTRDEDGAALHARLTAAHEGTR